MKRTDFGDHSPDRALRGKNPPNPLAVLPEPAEKENPTNDRPRERVEDE